MCGSMDLELPAGSSEIFPSLLAFCLGSKESSVIHPNQGCQPGSQRRQSGNQSLAPLFQIVPGRAVSGVDFRCWLPQEEPAAMSGQRLLMTAFLNC